MSRSVHEGFTERLERALKEAGFAGYEQSRLGAMFGVSGQAVRKWRRGESIPNAERAPLVADKLGVRRAWLLDNEPPMRPQHRVTEGDNSYSVKSGIALTGDEFKMLALYRQLSPQQQENLTAFLAGTIPARARKSSTQ